MPDTVDVGALQIAASVFGTVSAAFLVFLQVQLVKAMWPTLNGRGAVFLVYLIAAVTSAIVLIQAQVDLSSSKGVIALYIGMLSLGVIAQGIYANEHKVSVEGAPPSVDASVRQEDINDPHSNATQETGEHQVVPVERYTDEHSSIRYNKGR